MPQADERPSDPRDPLLVEVSVVPAPWWGKGNGTWSSVL